MDSFIQGPTCSTNQPCCQGDQGQVKAVEPSCSLNPSELPERVARWRRLFAVCLGHNVEKVQARFRFANEPVIMSELQELILLEEICCANVSWQVTESAREIQLTLIADAGSIRPLVNGFLPAVMDQSGGPA